MRMSGWPEWVQNVILAVVFLATAAATVYVAYKISGAGGDMPPR